jgi:cobalt-zinc-cadmium efflux system outer membrane protein
MKIRAAAPSLTCILLLAAGACVRYHARPISAPLSADAFESRRLDAPDLAAFVASTMGLDTWPPPAWDLHALTMAAVYYHPDLDIARAQWAAAEAGRRTAGERPNPTGSILMGYNATTPASEAAPWIPEAHLSDAARLNIISAAWAVRSRLRVSYLELYAAERSSAIFRRLLEVEEAGLRILEAQLAIGEVSPAVVTQARIERDQTRLSQLEAAARLARARAALASALGLPGPALEGIGFPFDDLSGPLPDVPARDARRQALLHRADVLAALSEYAARDASLRLELARQYPDIDLSPDYQLDQTDSKWTLGLSLILPLLNRNRGPIAEAEARRTESAARFEALQAGVIGEIEAAVDALKTAADKDRTAAGMQASLERREAVAKAQFEAGEISRLELLGVEMELARAALARLEAMAQARRAAGDLEDAMQSPLDLEAWTLKTPDRTSRPAKERKDD